MGPHYYEWANYKVVLFRKVIDKVHLRNLSNKEDSKALKVMLQSNSFSPIPVTARSKTWVCGRSLAGIAGLNPAGCMDVCLVNVVLADTGLCSSLITRPEKSYTV
jgi:hypothetical protein